MSNKYRFRYVRHPFNESRYIGVICFEEVDGVIWASFSQCHPNDVFSKKIGRAIAQHRLQHRYLPNEVPQIGYYLNGKKMRVWPITDTIEHICEDFYNYQHKKGENYVARSYGAVT